MELFEKQVQDFFPSMYMHKALGSAASTANR
jgi:hypothetical protein